MEVMQMENTHQQEGSGNENLGEQLGKRKRLQTQVLQTESINKQEENRSIKKKHQLKPALLNQGALSWELLK